MAKYITLAEAQEKLFQFPEELTHEPLIITKEGKPIITAINYEHFESLIETLQILADEQFSCQLQESIQQAENGETISWEIAKKQLGL
jgi:PHD/YefM family antitoxin component YafN of YafNO toxin-antitoxin module